MEFGFAANLDYLCDATCLGFALTLQHRWPGGQVSSGLRMISGQHSPVLQTHSQSKAWMALEAFASGFRDRRVLKTRQLRRKGGEWWRLLAVTFATCVKV